MIYYFTQLASCYYNINATIHLFPFKLGDLRSTKVSDRQHQQACEVDHIRRAYITFVWICILYARSSFVHMPSSARLLQLSPHSLFPQVGRHLPLLRMTSWWPIANDKNSHGVVCSCKMKPNVNWHPALSHSIVICPWWSCGPTASILCLILELQEILDNWRMCSWP